MSEFPEVAQAELGRYLTQVRERAGIKQAELARKITWSPAVLSRVETGERQLASEELQTILAAIGTPEAADLQSMLQREWSVLPRPPLDHPDQNLLWNAEEVAKELVALRDKPDVRHAFETRLSEYVREIQQTAALLLKRDHQIAFIGSIGIGKSTAICRLAGLEIPDTKGGHPVPVLEAGAGGITICEVHLRSGPGYGLLIEPRSDDEIRADVTDFAESILGSGSSATDRHDDGENDSQGISKEIERAVRNMAGLRIRRDKSPDGKTTRKDDARELAQEYTSIRELGVEVLSRMELHRRDRRDIWYESSTGKSPLVWLKDVFEQINNGRHPDFTLPKRIEVVIPHPILRAADLSVRIVDTKGIDRTATRADLESHLDDPHTLAVLCSGFNNAPAAEARLLLERAKEVGIRSLDIHTSLLVLPRPSEALAVKDEAGIRVESAHEGYELKGEQTSMSLQPMGLRSLSIGFFNAYDDEPELLRDFLVQGLGKIRQSFRARMHEIATNAKTLLANHEREQVQEVIRAATKLLRTWVTRNQSILALTAHVQDGLLDQMAKVHVGAIRASVRREGEWPNLSYSHHLGYGARRLAALSLGRTVDGFSDLCTTLSGTPDYAEAQDLISQAERVMRNSYEELLRKIQLMGQAMFRDAFKSDSTFWFECQGEWGRGPGYRNRVTSRNQVWFEADLRQSLERQLRALIEKEWALILGRVTSLFETDG
jgi:transcriptional regulator with XRE-family HTH domain